MTAVAEPSALLDPHLPAGDYFAAPGMSASGAKRILPPGCPALYRWEHLNGRPPKTAYDFGHAAHAMILGHGDPMYVVDAYDRRLKATRDLIDAKRDAGWIPLLRPEFAAARRLARAVQRHDLAGRLFADGDSEVSIFWRDPETDVECKARPDHLTQIATRVVAVDLKTTDTGLDDASIARAVLKFGYDIQAAHYLDGLAALGEDDAAFLFVFVAKTAPHLVRVVELDADFLARGRDRIADARRIYAECLASKQWPGYGTDIDLISPPRWA